MGRVPMGRCRARVGATMETLGWEQKERVVVGLTDKQASDLLASVGHEPLGIEVNARGKVRFECNCGYVSTYRMTAQDAIGAGIHHMRKEAQALLVNGRVPRTDRAVSR